MSDVRVSEPVKPRTCERCGKRMPPQKRGRPRKWCSQQCRQSAYEERNGLPSWKDQQPRAESLSDVVEVMQDRAARATPPVGRRGWQEPHRPGAACALHVAEDPLDAAFVIGRVTDVVRETGIPDVPLGRRLAEAVVELVNAVLERTARTVPAEDFHGFDPSTPEKEK